MDSTPLAITLLGSFRGVHEYAQEMADTIPEQPNIWSDGSREPIHLDTEVADAGVFTHFPAFIFDNN